MLQSTVKLKSGRGRKRLKLIDDVKSREYKRSKERLETKAVAENEPSQPPEHM